MQVEDGRVSRCCVTTCSSATIIVENSKRFLSAANLRQNRPIYVCAQDRGEQAEDFDSAGTIVIAGQRARSSNRKSSLFLRASILRSGDFELVEALRAGSNDGSGLRATDNASGFRAVCFRAAGARFMAPPRTVGWIRLQERAPRRKYRGSILRVAACIRVRACRWRRCRAGKRRCGRRRTSLRSERSVRRLRLVTRRRIRRRRAIWAVDHRPYRQRLWSLPHTRWRIKRTTRSEDGACIIGEPWVEHALLGERVLYARSLDLDRANSLVLAMHPFRMPRIYLKDR